MNFDIYKIFGDSPENMQKARQKVEEKFAKAGYELPNYTLALIDEIYNQIYAKESKAALRQGKEVSSQVSERIDTLKEATQIKLLTVALDKFNKGEESIEFAFNKGVPDANTSSLLTMIDPTGGLINHTRTDTARLPATYHSQKTCVFTITPEGDSVLVDGKPYGNADPVIDEINNMFKNVPPTEPLEQ